MCNVGIHVMWGLASGGCKMEHAHILWMFKSCVYGWTKQQKISQLKK